MPNDDVEYNWKSLHLKFQGSPVFIERMQVVVAIKVLSLGSTRSQREGRGSLPALDPKPKSSAKDWTHQGIKFPVITTAICIVDVGVMASSGPPGG